MAATDQRITALRAALELAPDDPAVRTLLAETLEGAERWDEAVVERRALVALDPADAPAKLALARAYAAAGNRGPAEVILDELEQAGRMPSDGWRLRGELQGHPGDDLDADRRDPAAGLEAEDADPTASHAGGPSVVVGDAGAPAGAFRARPSTTAAIARHAVRSPIPPTSPHPTSSSVRGSPSPTSAGWRRSRRRSG